MADKQKLTEAKKRDHIEKAASSYKEASDLYPPDDEHSQCTFSCFLAHSLWSCSPYLSNRLPLLRHRLHASPRQATTRHTPAPCPAAEEQPQNSKIWEVTTLAPSRDKIISAMLTYEKKALDAIRRKEVTEDDPYPPKLKKNVISLVHNVLGGAIYK